MLVGGIYTTNMKTARIILEENNDEIWWYNLSIFDTDGITKEKLLKYLEFCVYDENRFSFHIAHFHSKQMIEESNDGYFGKVPNDMFIEMLDQMYHSQVYQRRQ